MTSPRTAELDRAVCRVTVQGSRRRVDFTVPTSLSFGEITALLVARLEPPAEPAAEDAVSWCLQRTGDRTLDAAATPESVDLRHGELLHLRREDEALPALEYDDVAVGIETAVTGRRDHWRPELGRVLLDVAAGLVLLVAVGIALAGVAATAGGVVLGVGAVAAGVLACAPALADRPGLRPVGTGAAAGLAGLAAYRLLHTGDVLVHPTATETLVAAAAAGTAAGVVAAVTRSFAAVPVVVVAVSGVAAGAAVLVGLSGASGARIVLVVAVLAFLGTSAAVRSVLRWALLRPPQLPRTTDELQQDIDPEPQPRLHALAARAVHMVNGLIVAVAATAVWAAWVNDGGRGWAATALIAALQASLLLRARTVVNVVQRFSLVLGGTAGVLVVVGQHLGRLGTDTRVIVLVGLFAAVLVMVVAASRMPGRRPLPIWRRVADIVETVTAVALLPLLLQVLGAFAAARSLVG